MCILLESVGKLVVGVACNVILKHYCQLACGLLHVDLPKTVRRFCQFDVHPPLQARLGRPLFHLRLVRGPLLFHRRAGDQSDLLSLKPRVRLFDHLLK